MLQAIPARAQLKGDPEQARKLNTSLVLDAVRKHNYVSRAELSRILSISKMTTSAIVRDLINLGLVVETDGSTEPASTAGRPPVVLTLDTTSKYVVGVDIGTTSIVLVVGNLKGAIVGRKRTATNRNRDVDSVLGQVEVLVQELLAESRIPSDSVLGIGVSVAGLVDKQSGYVKFSPDFNWKGVLFRTLLEERLAMRVVINNCTRTAALGETWYGAATEAQTVFYVNVGYGIGSAIIIDGRMYEHTSEFGHIRVTSHPVRCECGKMGCLEAVSSGRAIETAANEGRKDEADAGWISAKELAQRARSGDQAAREVFQKAGKYLGRAISIVANLISPDVIIIGGGVSRTGELLMDPLSAEFEVDTMDAIRDTVSIHTSELGVDAGVVGAMTLALDSFVFQQGRLAI